MSTYNSIGDGVQHAVGDDKRGDRPSCEVVVVERGEAEERCWRHGASVSLSRFWILELVAGDFSDETQSTSCLSAVRGHRRLIIRRLDLGHRRHRTLPCNAKRVDA